MPDRYYQKKVPPGPWDTVVIGSGMGGMAAAALLASLGERVLVLEQHFVPGGFTHTFRRQKWRFDVGVHAVGEVGPRAKLGRLLAALTDHQLEWASLGPVYDEFSFPDDFSIAFPDSREAFFEVLVRKFPSERPAISRYLELVRDASGAMRAHFLSRALPPLLGFAAEGALAKKARFFIAQTTEEVIARLTSNERLRVVLTAQWGYHGSPPQRASFAAHALVAKHFLYGGSYPVGGSAQIAKALAGPVLRSGGAICVRALVHELILTKGSVRGVVLESGEQIEAKKVVSSIGAPGTLKLLPSRAIDSKVERWRHSLSALRPSAAHVCLYLGFKGDIRAAGGSSSNQWFYERWDHEEPYWNFRDKGREAPVLYTSFPSLKDPRHAPRKADENGAAVYETNLEAEAIHTGEVVTFVPFDAFARWQHTSWKDRGPEYETLKVELEERLLAQFFRHRPALKPLLAYRELSTPLSTVHFTRAPRASIYGLEASPARLSNRWLRPRTPLRGLYLGGCDVGMVGVMGAFVGGTMAAAAARPLEVFDFLRRNVIGYR